MLTPYYLLEPGDGTRPLTRAELASPRVTGATLRADPSLATDVVAQVADTAALCEQLGKAFTLLLKGGYDFEPTSAESVARRRDQFTRLVVAFETSRCLVGLHVPTIVPRRSAARSGPSEELYCGSPMSRELLEANLEMVDLAVDLARGRPRVNVLLAITAQDPVAQTKIATRASGLVVKVNSLKAGTRYDADHVTLLTDLVKRRGCRLGFEMAGPCTPQQFAVALQKARGVSQRCGKPVEYLAPYRGNVGDLA